MALRGAVENSILDEGRKFSIADCLSNLIFRLSLGQKRAF